MPMKLKSSSGIGKLLTEKILSDKNTLSFITALPDEDEGNSSESKSDDSADESNADEFEYLGKSEN